MAKEKSVSKQGKSYFALHPETGKSFFFPFSLSPSHFLTTVQPKQQNWVSEQTSMFPKEKRWTVFKE